MSQHMHLFVSMLLLDLTNMFFFEKYILNESEYEDAQELLPARFLGHSVFYTIVFYILS